MPTLSNDERDRYIDGYSSVEDPEPLDDTPLEGEIVELEDGSVEITLPEEDEAEEGEFGENLAEYIEPESRRQIANELIEAVERDAKSREKRQQQYEDGLRRTGLGDDAPGGAQFQGASRVVHPMLAEACVDFEARAIKELLPAAGPVRTSITSEDEPVKLEVAELKRDILNIQLTRLIPEYRDELESLLSQLPMGGSQYMKLWHDGRRKRVEFIPVDHMFLPFSVTNFYSSPRITHQQFITQAEFDARVKNGLYITESDEAPTENPTRSIVDVANDKIEGKEEDAYNEDGLREIFEIYLDYDFTEWDSLSDGTAPYIAHVDKFDSELLGLYRNWKEGDENFNRLDWIVDWGFIPWRGAYKLGLPHLMAGIPAAATGALRALLDSAHQDNAPTLLKLKAGRLVGQTSPVEVTQIHEIEGPAGINDIRQLVTHLPFKGPSPVLFQLLGMLVETGKGVVTTAEEKIADVSDRMPVGTSLAMIEQGSKVFSAIHARLHASQSRIFEILCRLNADYPETDLWERVVGRPVDPRIFDNTDDIAPVSDPNIFSEAQRFAQMQAVMQLMADPTINYNRIEGHRRMLRLLNVSNPDQLLPEPPKPKKADAVQENMFAVSGIPLKAFPDQDHLAHAEVHLRFILSPLYGAGPIYAGPQLAPILAHVSEHLTLHYPQVLGAAQAIAATQGVMLPDTTKERMQAVAMSGLDVVAQMQLAPIMQMIQQAQQLIQSKTPPPPMDPAVQATMQVAQMEDQRAKMQMQADMQVEQAKMQLEQAKMQSESAFKQQEAQAKLQLEQFKLQMEKQYEQLSAQVEIAKNDADNRQKQMTEIFKNESDNRTQVLIAQMKAELDTFKQSQSEMMPQQDDSMLKEMQRMLTELEKAKTNEALSSVMQGLQATMETLARPRVTKLQTGPDGKAIGAVSELS